MNLNFGLNMKINDGSFEKIMNKNTIDFRINGYSGILTEALRSSIKYKVDTHFYEINCDYNFKNCQRIPTKSKIMIEIVPLFKNRLSKLKFCFSKNIAVFLCEKQIKSFQFSSNDPITVSIKDEDLSNVYFD